jgi:hypothetical protein
MHKNKTGHSKEMKDWNEAIKTNLENLKLIQRQTPNMGIRLITKSISIPQMITWILYAAAVHKDFAKYARYPTFNLLKTDYQTPTKTFILPPESTYSSSSPTAYTTSSSTSSSSSSSSSCSPTSSI